MGRSAGWGRTVMLHIRRRTPEDVPEAKNSASSARVFAHASASLPKSLKDDAFERGAYSRRSGRRKSTRHVVGAIGRSWFFRKRGVVRVQRCGCPVLCRIAKPAEARHRAMPAMRHDTCCLCDAWEHFTGGRTTLARVNGLLSVVTLSHIVPSFVGEMPPYGFRVNTGWSHR